MKDFRQRASRLDVLWNNAGIMIPPKGTVTKQGYEAQLGVNVLAPFLFTKLLTDILISSAASSGQRNTTRIVWISSSAAGKFAPPNGVSLNALDNKTNEFSQWANYGMSKAASILLSREFARQNGNSGIVSVVCNLPFSMRERCKEKGKQCTNTRNRPLIQEILTRIYTKTCLVGNTSSPRSWR